VPLVNRSASVPASAPAPASGRAASTVARLVVRLLRFLARLVVAVRRARQRVRAIPARLTAAAAEAGQTTAEYALVILGAAAVATLLITWATKSHAVGRLFDTVIGKVVP